MSSSLLKTSQHILDSALTMKILGLALDVHVRTNFFVCLCVSRHTANPPKLLRTHTNCAQ